MKRLTLLIFLLVSVIGKSQTTYTWTGAVDNDFGTSGNWSPSGVPASGDDALFNSGSVNCNVASAIVIKSFSVLSGYTGNIDLGTSNHVLTGNLVINSGSVLSTTGVLEMDLNVGSSTFQLAGGAFNHNGGTFDLFINNGVIFTFAGNISLNTFDVQFPSGSTPSRTLDMGSNLVVNDMLFQAPGARIFAFQGTVHIQNSLDLGNMSHTTVSAANNGLFIFDGPDALIIGSTSTGAAKAYLPNIEVNTAGNLDITRSINVLGDWTGTAGTLVSATSTVNMYGSGSTISGPKARFNTLVLQSGSSVNTAASSSVSTTGSMSCVGNLNPGASSTISIGSNIISTGAVSSSSGFILNVTGNYTCTGGLTTGATSSISIGGTLRGTGLVTTGSTCSLGVVGNYSATAGLSLGASSKMTVGGAFTNTGTVSTGVSGTIQITGTYSYAGPINLGADNVVTIGSTLSGTSAITSGTGCTISSVLGFVNDGGINVGDGSTVLVGAAISGAGAVVGGNNCTYSVTGNYGNSGTMNIGNNSLVTIGGSHLSSGAITAGNTSTITIGSTFSSASAITLGTSCLFSTGSDLTASGSLAAGSSSTVDINGNYTCGGGLNLGAAADLRVAGDFIRNNASLVATSTSSLTLDGTGSQNISASAAGNALTIGVLKLVAAGSRNVNLTTAPLSIQNAVEVGNSITYATNNNMTLKSTNALTARVGQLGTGASITGSVLKETVIPGNVTGWANLGVPGIAGQTFASWDTYYSSGNLNGLPMICSGCTYTPGSVGNWFKSVQGWIEPTVEYDTTLSNTSGITPGTGYWVYVGDGQNTTNDLLLLNTGSLVQGNVPVTLTSAGTGSNQGSILLANPYASPISFSAFLLANGTATNGMVNGFSSWNADNNNYAVWNGSSGTNGASDVIAAGQGFYVVAGTSGNSLNFTESCKTTANTSANPLLRPVANPFAAKLQLQSPNKGEQDETVIALDNGATVKFDREHDMKKIKMSPGYPGYPGVYSDYTTIYSKDATGLEYAINTVPSDASATLVPLGVEVTTQGTYTISPIGVEMFASCLFLHDKQLNVYHDLKVKGDYAFTVNNVSPANRFELMLCANKSNGPVAITEMNSNQNHVSISKDDNTILVNTSFNEPTTATIEAYNILGQRIVAPLTVQGKENTVRIPADANSEIVIVKVTTDSGVYTKKVVMK